MGLPDGGVPAWEAALAVPMAFVVTFALGIVLGLINGLTVIYSRAASFIITLGFSTAYHGAALLASGGASYMLFGRFELLGRGRILTIIPISILFFLGMVALTFVVLRYFRYGRFLYAIGGNKRAAFVSGINTNRVTLIAYVVVGLCNALAALILISRVGSALATTGDSYALDSLAAVIVGGVALSGGRGSALSIFLGVLLIGLITNALIIMNVNPYIRDVVIGLIIVGAVTVSELSGQRRTEIVGLSAVREYPFGGYAVPGRSRPRHPCLGGVFHGTHRPVKHDQGIPVRGLLPPGMGPGADRLVLLPKAGGREYP